MSTPRIKQLSEGLDIYRSGRIPISIRKALLLTESMRKTEGMPTIMRSALAFKHVVENATIFIKDGELIVGNPASEPWGGELTPLWGTWPDEEIASLEADGYKFTAEDKDGIRDLNKYWEGRTLTSRMAQLYDDDVLWPYAQMGIVLPAFKSKEEGWGAGGLLGGGYGIHHEISNCIATPDYEMVFRRGLKSIIAEAKAELAATRLFSAEAVRKVDFLRAAIIALEATIEFAARFATLADEMALKENSDPQRRDELKQIAQICRRVPAEPARSFREALQCFWFMFLVMCPSTTLGMGRMDQIFYPWYRRDKDAGTLSDAEVVELFGLLRLRSMEIAKDGGRAHRSKWAGGAKWHNCNIGGQTRSGADATNELSYLILDAALACPTPHHTITMRVHEGTPSLLIRKALEVVRSGMGMPAFIGDPSMIDYLLTKGIPMADARDYNISGSLNVTLTGASRLGASPMFLLPRVLIIAMNGGVEQGGKAFGPRTKPLEEHATFDEFMASFKEHLAFYLKCQAEFNNVTSRSVGERFPRPIDSILMKGGITAGCDMFERTLQYDNSNHVNPIGIGNTADSLAAIRDLVFERKLVGAEELRQLLKDNWSGPRGDAVRTLCLNAPKFGNDDDRVDLLMAELFQFMAEKIMALPNITGGKVNPSALTIGTSPWPGGVITGATPDGRFAEDPLAEEALTPTRGRERFGPWEVIASATKIDQLPYHIAEMDLRFSRDALSSDGALTILEDMLRTYFRAGGKHIQFNVYNVEELRGAMRDPDNHKDLIVRLGGTSAYFVHLNEFLQGEMLKRSQFTVLTPEARIGRTDARMPPVERTASFVSPPLSQAAVDDVSRRRWWALGILLLLNTFLTLDKTIFLILLEPIKTEFRLTDFALGSLSGLVFAICMGVAGLPLGALVDRVNRRNLAAACLTVWSAMTMLCGAAQSFGQLLLTRMLVGVGEAGGAPASLSMIADLFEHRRRATATSIFALGPSMSTILSMIVGTWVVHEYGWRVTLVLAGAPGLLLALILLTAVREPTRGSSSAGSVDVAGTPGLVTTVRTMFAIPSFVLLATGVLLSSVVLAGASTWTNSFLVRVHGVRLVDIGPTLGLLMAAVGLTFGSVVGVIIDTLARRDERWRGWFMSLCAIASVLAGLCFLTIASLPVVLGCVALFASFVTCWLGPAYGLSQSLAPVKMRGKAVALLLLIGNTGGYIIGPALVGFLSDVLGIHFGANGLRFAMLAIITLNVLASLMFLLMACHLRADLQVAQLLDNPSPVRGSDLARNS